MTTAIADPSAPTDEELIARYGYRDVPVYDDAGRCIRWDLVPLTLEQCLHPEETDHPVADSFHDRATYSLRGSLQALAPDALVTSDMSYHWGAASGLTHHRPDVAVTFGVADLLVYRPHFDCDDEGTRPMLIVEVVSPSTRENDVEEAKKVGQYRRAGIEWYVIVDREEVEDIPTLIGRHLEDGAWVMMEPDDRGRLHLPPVHAWLRVENGEVVVTDARTGRDVVIGDVAPLRDELDAERQAREDADRRAEAERQARADADRRSIDLERRLAELEAKLRAADPSP